MPGLIADYIIVGAGSAGCMLANRLSGDPKRPLLLLEGFSLIKYLPPARGRCLDYADDIERQHQRSRHHVSRKSCRLD